MRNVRFIIIVLVALIAGYIAYPYFNPPKESSVAVTPPESKSRYFESSTPADSATEETKTARPLPNVPDPQTTSVPETTKTSDDSMTDRSGDVPEDSESKKSTSKSFSNFKTFSGQGRNQPIRDFAFYKLKKSDARTEISQDDPRLVLIRGLYTGLHDGNSYELEIGSSESTLRMNEDITVSNANENFFSNINDNGNSLQIENGKNKIYVDIKNWPSLVLTMGLSTKIFLRKLH